MAKWKKARGNQSEEQQLNAKLRRHYKDKARREKLIRAKPPGFKEKFVSGCMALGITIAIVLVFALVWIWVRHRFFE